MNRFSELVANGVAAFNEQPLAKQTPELCPVCREYNNTFGAATDTHMSTREDGTKIITGSLISKKDQFNRFTWSGRFAGVDFCHSKVRSFCEWMQANGFKGKFDIVNNDNVYILSPLSDEEKLNKCDCPCICMNSCCVGESLIPMSTKYLTIDGNPTNILECIKDTLDDTVKAMNESHFVIGNNWRVITINEEKHIIGDAYGKRYYI